MSDKSSKLINSNANATSCLPIRNEAALKGTHSAAFSVLHQQNLNPIYGVEELNKSEGLTKDTTTEYPVQPCGAFSFLSTSGNLRSQVRSNGVQ